MSHGNEMICQPVTLAGYAEWPKVADAVIEALNTTVNMDKIRGFRPQNVWTKTFVFFLTIDRESTDRCFLYACYGNPKKYLQPSPRKNFSPSVIWQRRIDKVS
jgi:hypothetical protein